MAVKHKAHHVSVPTTPRSREATEERAVLSGASKNDLPDACFAYIEPGGSKDSEGKTVPRSKRHLPYRHPDGSIDLPHLRNALARVDTTDISDEAKASARRKLEAAAREHGVGDYDQEESARVTKPSTTRAEEAATLMQMPLSVIRIDEGKREVTLRATSEATDTFKTAFSYAASKDAFKRWEQTGNIREMHKPDAVGTAAKIDYLDDQRAIDLTLRVSKGAENTWQKVLDRTLKGGSIGASNVRWEIPQQRAAGGPEKVATYYDLVEVSLVDNPSNPEALITCVRNAQPDMTVLDYQEDATTEAPKGLISSTPKGIVSDSPSPSASHPAIAAAMANAYDGTVSAQETRANVPDMMPQATPTWRESNGTVNMGQPGNSPVPPAIPQSSLPQPSITEVTDQRAAKAKWQADRNQRSAFATMAADKAERAAHLAVPTVGQNYDTYLVQRAAIRGEAERVALAQWDAEHPNLEQRAVVDHTMAVDFHPAANGASSPSTGIEEGLTEHADPNRAVDDTKEMELVDEEHQHEDGTSHKHPHHRPKGSRRAAGTFTTHQHEYLMGKPIDAALLTPEFLRGTPWQIEPLHEQDKILKANPPKKAAQTAVSKVTPQVVGQPVMYNTEDATALGFAVPTDASGDVVHTPDKSNITLDPAQFHAGGHKPRFDNADTTKGYADQDGDYDHEEDAREAHGEVKTPSVPVPNFTSVPYDYEATPMERYAQATENRVGARNSAADVDSMHAGWRDGALQNASAACDHCGCEMCQAMKPVLVMLMSGQVPATDGDYDGDEDEDDGDEEENALERTQFAEIQRTSLDLLSEVVTQLERLQDQTTQNTQIITATTTRLAQADTNAATVLQRISDLQLSLAETQRTQQATVTRAATGEQANAQLLQQLAASVAGVQVEVERIARTPKADPGPLAPYAVGGPIMATEKRLQAGYTQVTKAPDDLLKDEITRAAANLTPQQQADVFANYFRKG